VKLEACGLNVIRDWESVQPKLKLGTLNLDTVRALQGKNKMEHCDSVPQTATAAATLLTSPDLKDIYFATQIKK
jgi:hypothetical protein